MPFVWAKASVHFVFGAGLSGREHDVDLAEWHAKGTASRTYRDYAPYLRTGLRRYCIPGGLVLCPDRGEMERKQCLRDRCLTPCAVKVTCLA